MAFTDHCDVFGSFHEDGFNRIVDHVRFQRPSMFNYATQAIADNPALLCQPIVAHPRLNAHGNPLVTIIDPLDLPGTNFALNFSVQLVDVKIDFHPPNVVTLPPELAPLPVQRLAIGLRVCAGIGCPPAAVVESLIPLPPDPDADPNQPPPPPPPKVVLPPDQQLICVCLDASAVGGLRFKQYFQHFFLEPFVDRIEISDIQPADLIADLLGSIVDLVRVILDIGDDIQEWLEDLLGVSLGLENIIGQALIEHFVTDEPLFELEDPYPILGEAPNPNDKQGQPPLPKLVPVKLPIRDLTVSNNDVELILEGNVG
jgi:hypothetical protein